MRTTKNNISATFFTLLVALPLGACVSTPKTPEPPLWDTQGIQRIAVMPFEVIGDSELERDGAKQLTLTVIQHLNEIGRFVIVDSVDQADAIFRGEIIDYVVKRWSGNRAVVIINYSLTRTSDGSLVGENAVYFSDSIGEFRWHLSQELGGIYQNMSIEAFRWKYY